MNKADIDSFYEKIGQKVELAHRNLIIATGIMIFVATTILAAFNSFLFSAFQPALAAIAAMLAFLSEHNSC